MEYYKVLSTENARIFFEQNGYNLPYILRINGISELCEGDYLLLQKQTGKLYEVKPFDTYEKIAEKFFMTKEKLQELNNYENLVPFSQILIE